MDENVAFLLESAEEAMDKSVEHLDRELLKIRAGRANPVMLEGVMVDYFGSMTPLNQLATVSSEDARTLLVRPFDRKELPKVERAIIEANLGFNPQNDGNNIRIPIPMLTEERRKQLTRQAREEGEKAKISIRNVRRDHNSELKKLKDEGVSEDQIKDGEGEIQSLTNKFSTRVDGILKKKEDEIMTV
ncbi:MAG TPA: ribosome recycling factor [Bacteroidetes bacterium]|nr:ribosome recycling factor [Bacteroidota bacterium]